MSSACTSGSRPSKPEIAGFADPASINRVAGALALVALTLLSACATRDMSRDTAPRLQRLQELPTVAATPLTQEDVVRLSASGMAPDAIVRQWREDGARLRLGAGDIVALHRQGVPVAVLEALIVAREQALRADLDTTLVQRQQDWEKKLEQERRRPQQCPSPYGWGVHPYGAWGHPGALRSGVFWGW